MIRRFVALAIVAIAAGPAAAAAPQNFGAGVSLKENTPIERIIAKPSEFEGKTVRVEGTISAVCTEMGCWLAIGADNNPDQAVRFQAEHDGKIVFPISMKGQKASAEGVFVKIGASDHEAKEAAGEHAHSQPKAAEFGNRYQFQVTGAVAP